MDIGKKIALCRKESHMSQEALAAELGISRQAVSRWETGEAVPDTGKVVELARLFSVTTDYLLFDEQNQKNQESQTAVQSSSQPAASFSPAKKRALFRILLWLAALLGGTYMIYYSLTDYDVAFRGWIFSIGVALFCCGIYAAVVEYQRGD